MKKILLCMVLSLLWACPVLAGQQIFIPYAVSDDQWWSGLCVHNLSNTSQSFEIGAYSKTGQWLAGENFNIPKYAMEVKLLEDFFDNTLPSSRVSVIIRTKSSDHTFQATLFVGTETGFGFQNYSSYDWTPPSGNWWEDLTTNPIPFPKIPIIP